MEKKKIIDSQKSDKLLKFNSIKMNQSEKLHSNKTNQTLNNNLKTTPKRIYSLQEKKGANYHSNRGKKSLIKSFVMPIISAVIIGSLLGLVMLNLFANLEDNQVDTVNNSVPVTTNHSNDDKNTATDKPQDSETSFTLEKLNGYILQAGVFSEKENAMTWSESYTKAGFPITIWERGGQYFLFAGLTKTKEQADLFANEIATHGLDIFIKEWGTVEKDIEVTKEEQMWIQSFYELWETTLLAMDEQKVFPKEAWDELANKPLSSETLLPLIKSIKGLPQANTDSFVGQNNLLAIWQQYEEVFY